MESNTCFHGELDSVNMPLEGITLIEAAAGTGKTYNIQNIAARLIVEKKFPIESLAIVTFTEKAVQELSDRIRGMLELLTGVLNNRSSANRDNQERAKSLLEHFDSLDIPRKEQKELLENALRDIDNCRIATIHGFCFRLLSEYAFESSTAFQVQLEKDIKSVHSKLLKDFCRSKRYSSFDLPGWVDLRPSKIEKEVHFLLGKCNIKHTYQRPVFADENAIIQYLQALQQEFAACPDKALIMKTLQDKVNKICNISPELYITNAVNQLSRLNGLSMSDWQSWHEIMTLFRKPRFLGRGKAARKKTDENYKEFVDEFVNQNKIFSIAEEYCMVIEKDCNTFLIKEAVDFIRKNVAEWKQKSNVLSYDDLLIRAEQALKNKSFCNFVQKKLNVGIIDEFQDTDPLQYNIFKSIFIDRPGPGALFMVGDPRQAIYAFRGGDIATYLAARQECIERNGRIYTLTTNYRSSGRMIEAFNCIFKHNDPFFSSEISFEEVGTPAQVRPGIRLYNEEMQFPLSAQYYSNCRLEDIFERSADEICRMISCGKFTIPDGNDSYRKITPGDIAVLTEKNKHLDMFRKYLAKYNIPVIGERQGGLWSSDEAIELAKFMQAVLNNADSLMVRDALLTEICGVTLPELDVENPDTAEKMLAWRMDFINLAECWYERGTAVFMATFIKLYSLKERLTCVAGGDRALSNYIQMGDLLAGAELANKLPPRGVLKFLQEKIAAGSSDEMEMLESDRSAVHLMTIHKSKGLQFPVVFLIDLSSRRALGNSSLSSYHCNGELCCNVDKLDKNAEITAGIEDMQELMRLVYVAVTRACYFCRINWNKSRNMERSMPLTWLFSRQDTIPGDTVRRSFICGDIPFADGDMNIPGALQQKMLFDDFTPTAYQPPLDADIIEPETAEAPAGRRYIISYSALNELGHKTDVESDKEFTDRDSGDEENNELILLPEKEKSDKLSGGIWSVPPGAAIGNAWHEILENTDFTQGVDGYLLKNIMTNYGFNDPAHLKASAEMFRNLLEYQLPCGMKLKELTADRRLTELEFLLSSPQGFTFDSITCAVNEYVAAEFGPSIIPTGFLNMHRGFFTGFIDMVFEYNNKLYIVDWKSNALGSLAESFYGNKLKQHMFKKLYPLQYLCYLAALLKYLEQRLQKKVDETLYNEYVGGVYYIFLRGMMLENPGGVFEAHVPYRFVRSLADVITCGKGE
ncbi:MAG: UvrD-helicase domain-containing protein [Lentisphaeria bacterium]|nr:UvrD-helicase domain-containing protein [Lentisphaeria bacterium]